jgi:hypothetical protein
MPPATPKKRLRLEPISYDELLSNAGMSGFVSFLEQGSSSVAAPVRDAVVARTQPHPPVPLKATRNGRQTRIWKAQAVEDGHSLAEQAVYEALWSVAFPVNESEHADRTIRIGYHRLAQITRLSWVSVKANLRSLEKKLAIQVIASENSATQEGKSYHVYSRPAILDRRRKAGLEWVRRTRGVELLSLASLDGGGNGRSIPS